MSKTRVKTLADIKKMAMRDHTFFRALLRDYELALKKRNIILSPADMLALKKCLATGLFPITAEQYLELTSGKSLAKEAPGVWICRYKK
jgi:hypothetical protein